jgi:FKBP-type peptidyl-prolyl cis-trans isomerase FklB
MESQYGANREAGREYLANKAKEDGIVATGSGLLYRVIKEGKGAKPQATDRVRVNYRGSLIDGTVFDESTKPITLSLASVIEGWTEALQLMSVGSKYELFIPYELGYGDSNNGMIQPYSALIFEVELVDIEK